MSDIGFISGSALTRTLRLSVVATEQGPHAGGSIAAGGDKTAHTGRGFSTLPSQDATPQRRKTQGFTHTQLSQQAADILAARGLLDVARGYDPPSFESIIDVDMSLLPMLPESHTHWNARIVERIDR